MEPVQKTSPAIPIAIVVGFGLIAAAIFFSGGSSSPTANVDGAIDAASGTVSTPSKLPAVSENDHILGNPNASIFIVEYSDYDCPFCKNFHETMNRIIDEYGPDGRVAWVYRQFPLESLHPNAPKISEASECVAELGGNDAFWIFSDLVFKERSTNEQTNITRLPEFATIAGVDETAFSSCLESGKYTTQISDSVDEAVSLGARGTPHSFVIVGDQQGVINGAQPYETVKQIIDNLITQIDGGNAGG